jgi:predicted Fe-Mo cluster-binding NifX family protein
MNFISTKEQKMKIAVSSRGKYLDSPLDPRFGRCEGFVMVNTETMEFSHLPNVETMQLSSGAGIQAAKSVADAGAAAVLTGRVGPKAYAALQKAGLEIYVTNDSTVSAAIENYKAGKLSRATASSPMGAGKGRGGGAGMGGRGGGMGRGMGRS